MYVEGSKKDLQIVLSELSSQIRVEQDKSHLRFEDYAAQTVDFDLDPWQSDHFLPILGKCAMAKRKRLMIHAPPQAGKSVFMSGRYAAFILGMDPFAKICLCAFNEDRAVEFSKLVLETLRSEEHLKFFGGDDRSIPVGSGASVAASAKSWKTKARAGLVDTQMSVRAVGLTVGVVGSGFDHIIIDDPYSGWEDSISEATNRRLWYLYKKVILPRIKDGNLYWMFHRWHPMDIIGKILEDEPGVWDYVRFPEMADENEDGSDPTGRAVGELLSPRMSLEDSLKIIENDPGTWMALHQGTPTAEEGGLIRPDQFVFIDAEELPGYHETEAPWGDFKRFSRSWDIAASKDQQRDHTAGALMSNNGEDVYILDMQRFQKEWPEAEDAIVETALIDPPGTVTVLEQAALSIIAVQAMKRRKEFRKRPVIGLAQSKDKRTNALGWAGRGARGKIYVVKSRKGAPSPWLAKFCSECRVFDGLGLSPDDQVDAVSLGFRLLWAFGPGIKQHEQKAAWLSHAWLREMRRIKKNAESQRQEEYGNPERGWDEGDIYAA